MSIAELLMSVFFGICVAVTIWTLTSYLADWSIARHDQKAKLDELTQKTECLHRDLQALDRRITRILTQRTR